MAENRSSVLGMLPARILIALAMASFLFYGIAGADKILLLGPVFVLAYAVISVSLFKQAWGRSRALGGIGVSSSSSARYPASSLLWLLFFAYGIALVFQAAIPFEAKSVLWFLGCVVGAYMVWGAELTAFKDNRLVLGGLVFVVMLTALYGLVVHFKCPDRVLWGERYAMYEGRLMSTYICPNHFAHLMQMLLPFCLALLFIPQSGLYLKILSAYSLVVFLPPMFLTESRAGWLGSLAGVGVAVCLMALRRSKKLFLALVVLVPLASTLLLFGAWRYSETFQRRMEPVVEFLQGQAEGGVGSEARDFRPQTWMDTIDMVKAAPWFGHGPGSYRYTFPEYRNRFRGHRIVTGHPHNEYLELIAEFGLVGFGLFALAWIYGGGWVLVKSLRAAETRHAFIGFAFIGTLAGTMVHSFFDFQMHVFPNAMVFALLAAIAAGPLRATRGARTAERRKRRPEGRDAANPRGFGGPTMPPETAGAPETPPPINRPVRRTLSWLSAVGGWLLAIAFVAGTAFCAKNVASDFARALGDKAMANRDIPQVEQGYRRATRIDAQNWQAYRGMAQLLHDRRWFSLDRNEKVLLAQEELGWFEQAYRHNPKDAESVLGLGKVLVFLGRQQNKADQAASSMRPTATADLEALGLEYLREACRYRKFNDQVWWLLGVELRKAGLYEEALETFKYAGKLRRTPSIAKNIQWLEKMLSGPGDKEAAIPPAQKQDRESPVKKSDLAEMLDKIQ
ncbi:O-antigen ligase family protein [Pontiella sp.]|uniref:O-antigen ligase family protein n=1 Tax=Pontiella sp. TaxID=2837462 RepID=UPI0035639FC3